MRSARRARMLSAASETAVVAALSHEGVGVVHGGKAAFVSGALPGETIRFRRRRPHRQYDEAELEEVLEPSADRVEPRCLHFDICGGCALQHLAAPAQLQLKEQLLRESLERIARTSPARWLPAVAGRVWGYRRRARLSAKFVEGKGRVLVGFRERLSSLIASIDRCEVLAAPLDGMIRSLSDLIMQLSIRERLPQIEVAVADNAVALVLRVLEPPTAGDLERLRAFETQHGVRFYLQSGGLESVRSLTEPAAVLTYALPEADLELEFAPTDFIQVNGEVNRALVHAAVELLELDGSSRVLDLYCGLGNFSLAIARRAQAVVGIEGDSALVERAQSNARRNGLSNAEFHRADLSTELSGARWLAQPYTHVLLDPPRAGARELLPQLARLAPTRLLYVSCHPGTLARDIGELVHQHGFELLAAGVVDMFAHTAHMESLALLAPRRRR